MGETVRAEEIALSAPDRHSVTALDNAAPIRSRDGTARSVVVTLQDLAPVHELDCMRPEFLGMVSQELRIPLATIKGPTTEALSGGRLSSTETQAFLRVVDGQADCMIRLVADLLDAARIRARTLSVAPESTDAAVLMEGARTAFLFGGGRHPVTVDLLPDGLPRVAAFRRRIEQVLNNLPASAARHALAEAGRAPLASVDHRDLARAREPGAADDLVKPFSATELVARVRAALGRQAAREPFVSGEFVIDHDQRLVTVAGREAELTRTEFDLPRLLSFEAGRIVTCETVLDQVWSRRDEGGRNPVHAFDKQFRAKLVAGGPGRSAESEPAAAWHVTDCTAMRGRARPDPEPVQEGK